MAATTTDRNTTKRASNLLVLPVAASTKLPAGVLAARDGDGNLVNASDTAGLTVIGRVNTHADNSAGTAGALSAEVERGVFLYDNDTGGTPVAAGDEGKVCYVLDNQTVSADAGSNNIVAGLVHAVGDEGVWVDTAAGAAATAAIDVSQAAIDALP